MAAADPHMFAPGEHRNGPETFNNEPPGFFTQGEGDLVYDDYGNAITQEQLDEDYEAMKKLYCHIRQSLLKFAFNHMKYKHLFVETRHDVEN